MEQLKVNDIIEWRGVNKMHRGKIVKAFNVRTLLVEIETGHVLVDILSVQNIIKQ